MSCCESQVFYWTKFSGDSKKLPGLDGRIQLVPGSTILAQNQNRRVPMETMMSAQRSGWM
jgi:hypothetical protein